MLSKIRLSFAECPVLLDVKHLARHFTSALENAQIEQRRVEDWGTYKTGNWTQTYRGMRKPERLSKHCREREKFHCPNGRHHKSKVAGSNLVRDKATEVVLAKGWDEAGVDSLVSSHNNRLSRDGLSTKAPKHNNWLLSYSLLNDAPRRNNILSMHTSWCLEAYWLSPICDVQARAWNENMRSPAWQGNAWKSCTAVNNLLLFAMTCLQIAYIQQFWCVQHRMLICKCQFI